jgi:hypothetical protein
MCRSTQPLHVLRGHLACQTDIDQIEKQLQEVSARENELLRDTKLNVLELAERQMDSKRERERILREGRRELAQKQSKDASKQLDQSNGRQNEVEHVLLQKFLSEKRLSLEYFMALLA